MSAPIAINVASTVASSSPSSPGLYVPVHKRTGSSSSSPSPSSPTSTLPLDTTPSYVYSPATLLSLLPFADESMKGKMRASCPEVVMNRKMRKGLEFNGRRTEVLVAQHLLIQEPTLSAFGASPIHINASPTVQTSTPARVLPRRSRPAGRTPERRRNPFASSFGARRTGNDSWRPQAVPMSPVLLT